jgi:AraC-like DNA-binding protein
MQDIKLYKEVHDAGQSPPFAIKRMEDYWEIQQQTPDSPHRHDYYTILLVADAEGSHFIDFNEYMLSSNQVFFVGPGQVHQIVEKRQSVGFVITFGQDFLVSSNIPISFIEDLEFFKGFGDSPPLSLNASEAEMGLAYCTQMLEVYHSNKRYKLQALGSLLQLFLIHCNNLCTIDIEDIQSRHTHQILYSNFRELIELNFRTEHNLQFYADGLFISADHLTRVVKSGTGKSAKELLQERIITEAKRELCFTSKTAKEIGYDLGFNEPAYFSTFFKNCTGFSPSTFRKSV